MIKKAQKVRKNLHNSLMINENSRKKGKRVIFVKKRKKGKKGKRRKKRKKRVRWRIYHFFGVCRL